MMKKILSLAVIVNFFLTSLGPVPAHADSILGLPTPGAMINLSSAYQPVIIRGLTVHKDNPFLFDFIVDVGQDRMSGGSLEKECERLIKYFMASLAIPDKDFWVNLSPYEKDKIIPDALSQTDMGRDLLEQDYILKQMTASLINPEKQLGKVFWDKVYAKAKAMYGRTEIPVNTFNKVWIMADKASVFEHGQTVFVVDQHLKVMLEEDYLALNKQNPSLLFSGSQMTHKNLAVQDTHTIASQIVRKIILPQLEQEVNTGKNFANLRQIFNSIILSSWYKNNLKQSLLNQVYADKSRIKGIDLNDPNVKEEIYQQYLKAYKKGVFNFIKEDINSSGQSVPRKYFSGGILRTGVASDPSKAMVTAFEEVEPGWNTLVDAQTGLGMEAPNVGRVATGKGKDAAMHIGFDKLNKFANAFAVLRTKGLTQEKMEIVFNGIDDYIGAEVAEEGQGLQEMFDSAPTVVRAEKGGVKDSHNKREDLEKILDDPDLMKFKVTLWERDNREDKEAYWFVAPRGTAKELAEKKLENYIESHRGYRDSLGYQNGLHKRRSAVWATGGDESYRPASGYPAASLITFTVRKDGNIEGQVTVKDGAKRSFNIEHKLMHGTVQDARKMNILAYSHYYIFDRPNMRALEAVKYYLANEEELSVRDAKIQEIPADGAMTSYAVLHTTAKEAFIDGVDNGTIRLRPGEIIRGNLSNGGNILLAFFGLNKSEILFYTYFYGDITHRELGAIESFTRGKFSFGIPRPQRDTIIVRYSRQSATRPDRAITVQAPPYGAPRNAIRDYIAELGHPTEYEHDAISADINGLYDAIQAISDATIQQVRDLLKSGIPVKVTFYIKGYNHDGKTIPAFFSIDTAMTSDDVVSQIENAINNSGEHADRLRVFYNGNIIITDMNISGLRYIDQAGRDYIKSRVEHHNIRDRQFSFRVQYYESSTEVYIEDQAMRANNVVSRRLRPGGIDLNTSNGTQWKVSKDGKGVEMTINPSLIERIRRIGISGLSPFIIRITPIINIWSLAGLKAPVQVGHAV